jgi:hypothetical protein
VELLDDDFLDGDFGEKYAGRERGDKEVTRLIGA